MSRDQFVEETFRGQGVASGLLNWIRQDCGRMGMKRLYLLTEHSGFYEACGWEYFKTISDDEGGAARVYTAAAL